MIAPLIPFAIRGAIWYQGESNGSEGYHYRTLFPAMIGDWRRAWGRGDFPFLFVQLANYRAPQLRPSEFDGWAELREAQTMTLDVPNTAMAVTIDIGHPTEIHPRNKQDVGRRLALGALKVAYGRDLVYSGPIYDSMSVEGDSVRLRFKHVGSGLTTRDGEKLKGFAIAGADRRFAWGQARIDGDTIVVRSPKVAKPVAVRYGWADNPVCNLFNKEGLPASPFRTDDWPGVSFPYTPEQFAEQYPTPEPVGLAKLAEPAAVDGDLAEWAGVRAMPLPFDMKDASSLRLAWREDGLYGALAAADASVSTGEKPLEGVEIYVEKDAARSQSRTPNCAIYSFSPAGDASGGDGRVNIAYSGNKENETGIRCAWRPSTGGYALEFFIPTPALAPAQMKAGAKLGLNFVVNNDGRPVEQFFCDRDWWRGAYCPIMWGAVELTP